MSGSISLSLSQQFDSTGAPLNGGLLYFYAAGTTTPQSAYQDTSLTLPWPNPIVLDSAGRVPAFYLEDGQIKIRLTDANGVVQVAADNLLVVGASSGSGSAPSVDATTILATGDVKFRYGTGALAGFVRANGRTMGSGSSGGTERANADCQSLFEYLWTADANLSVSTGRGGSANADWVANKTITLPDGRGRALAGLDDMGSSAAGVLTGTNFGVSAIVLGNKGGAESHTVAQGNLPNVNLVASSLTASSVVTNGGNVHVGNTPGGAFAAGGTTVYRSADIAAVTVTVATTMGGTVPLGGSGTSLPTVSPLLLVTTYLKL
jgi:hypothetical protein